MRYLIIAILFCSFLSLGQHKEILYLNEFNVVAHDSVFSTNNDFELVTPESSVVSFDGSNYIRAKGIENDLNISINRNWQHFDSVILEMNLYYKSTYLYGHMLKVTDNNFDTVYYDLKFGSFQPQSIFRFNITKYLSAKSIQFLYSANMNDKTWFCYIDNLKIIGYSNLITGTEIGITLEEQKVTDISDLQGNRFNSENRPSKTIIVYSYSDGSKKKVLVE